MKLVVLGCGTAIAAIAVLSFLGGSFYSVDEGERAVITRNGAFVEVEGPGFHTKTPFIEDASILSLRANRLNLENVPTFSFDQQTAQLQVTIIWRATPGSEQAIYTRYETVERLGEAMQALATGGIKEVFGRYTAAKAVNDRATLGAEASDAVIAKVKDLPLTIDAVQIVDIGFSDAYERAIDDRMQAEIDVARKRQEADKAVQDARITVTGAQAEADSNLARSKAEAEGNFARAKAEADGIRVKAIAEAESIRIRGEALAKNPHLIALTTAERWNGALPTTMVPGQAVPFVNIAGGE